MDRLSTRSSLAAKAGLDVGPPVSIGSATLHSNLRELHGGGAKIRLEPRAMEVLLVLADAAGRTVTRNALFQICWNGTIVDESALNRVIAQIRRAAAKTGSAFTIETLPKVGYRLETAGASNTNEPSHSLGLRRRSALVAGGVLALSGISAIFWVGRPIPRSGEAAELERRARLALLDMLPGKDGEAVAMLREAAALEPRQATIWGALALAHQRAAELGPAEQVLSSTERTRAAARQALALDPANADAQVALALIAPVYRHWLRAEENYRDLGDRFPNHTILLAGHAKLLAEVGRFESAVGIFDRVFELEPLAPAWHWRRGLGLWAANRSGEAIQLLEKALRIWPGHPSVWAATFWVNAYTGSPDRSLALLEVPAATSISEAQRAFMQRSAVALATRDPEVRREAIMSNRQSAAQSTSAAEHAMAVAAALGDPSEAISLARAYHFGEGVRVTGARLEAGTEMPPDRRKTLPLFWPPMAAVRTTTEFDALIRRLGLTEYWQASKTMPDFQRDKVRSP